MENDNNPRTKSYDDKQLVSETSLGRNCEKKVGAASGNQTETSTVKVSQSQNSRKRKMSESSCDPGKQVINALVCSLTICEFLQTLLFTFLSLAYGLTHGRRRRVHIYK